MYISDYDYLPPELTICFKIQSTTGLRYESKPAPPLYIYPYIKGKTLPITNASVDIAIPELKSPKGIWLCPSTELAPDAGAVMRMSYGPTICCFNAPSTYDPPRVGGFVYAYGSGSFRKVAHKVTRIPANSVIFVEKTLVDRPVGYPDNFNFPNYTNGTNIPHSAAFRHKKTGNFLFMDMHVEAFRRWETKFDNNWIPYKP